MGQCSKFAALALSVILSGCSTTPTQLLPPPDKYAVALGNVPEEWLSPLPAPPERRGNAIGDLLQDYVEITSYAARYRARHEALAEYLRPLVEEAKQPPTQ